MSDRKKAAQQKGSVKSDLERLDALSDEDIDYSEIPELDENFFKTARVVVPPKRKLSNPG